MKVGKMASFSQAWQEGFAAINEMNLAAMTGVYRTAVSCAA
jgi:hypothetical protein